MIPFIGLFLLYSYISHEKDKGFPGWVNLIGIESPGLTSAIAIGEDVATWIK